MTRLFFPLIIILFLCSLTGLYCEEKNSSEEQNAATTERKTPEKIASDVEIDALAYSNNELGLEIYSLIPKGQDNAVFSPYSIVTALQMLYTGSSGLTQSQIARVLHFGFDPLTLEASAKGLRETISVKNQRAGENVSLWIANSLWFQRGHPTLTPFEEKITKIYGGTAKSVDFRTRGDSARNDINLWVQNQTHGKIPSLVGKALSNTTRLLLASAIYMQGKWQHSFDPQYTRMFPFFPSTSTTLTVPMMTMTETFPYLKGKNFTALELPYASKVETPRFSMIILLPDETFGLENFERSLTAQMMINIQRGMQKTKVILALPKFKIIDSLELKDPLKALGLTEPFSSNADFSAIDGSRDLVVNEIFQKAFIAIDEKGTEAGVATGISLGTKSIAFGPAELFTVDHPFLFFVIEKFTDTILFMGRVTSP